MTYGDILFNAVGLVGMAQMLLAYFLQQYGKITGRDGLYLWLNLVGAVAVMVSLLRFWNLPSFVLECAWALISLYGILKRKRSAA